MQRHTLHPSASPYSVDWNGLTRIYDLGMPPESRPRESSVGSCHALVQSQIGVICARMGSGLRALTVHRASHVSMATFLDMSQLESLSVDSEATVTDVQALIHLTRLTALHAPIGLVAIRHVPESCREITVNPTGLQDAERRSAWLQVLRRPLTALTIGDADIGVIADIGSRCRTLHILDMASCAGVAPLAALPHLAELQYAPDSRAGVDDGLGRPTTLRRLDLIGRQDDGMRRVGGLACLSALANLTDLRLHDYPATAADVADLCAARCSALAALDLNIDGSAAADDDDAKRLDLRPLSALGTLVNLGLWASAAVRRADLPHPLPRLARLDTPGAGDLDVERPELDRMYPALKHVNPDA